MKKGEKKTGALQTINNKKYQEYVEWRKRVEKPEPSYILMKKDLIMGIP